MPFPQQTLLCLYRYDPLNRLISHTQSQASPLQRFYCKSRLATEIQGALLHSIVQHDDLLLAQQQRQDDVLDTTLLATDLQRSILQTIKANQPRHSIAYSPYGHRRPENGLLSLLGFNGERPDPVTGHYLLGNGYRAFNPVLMRFNSPDSWSPFEAGGLNAYAYCLGDPVGWGDRSGHSILLELAFQAQKRRSVTNGAIKNSTMLKSIATPSPPNRFPNMKNDYEFSRKLKKFMSRYSLGKPIDWHNEPLENALKKFPDQFSGKVVPSLFEQSGRQFTGNQLNSLVEVKKLPDALVRQYDELFGEAIYMKSRYKKDMADGMDFLRLSRGDEPGILPQRAGKQIRESSDYKRYIDKFGEGNRRIPDPTAYYSKS